MPSQRTVALSLDEETLDIWDSLPRGERSKRVRDALKQAENRHGVELVLEGLRAEIKSLKDEVYHLKWGGDE
tara:strand:- start:96 stop:311 length:216 start_codon:yes stop_codon:yes gene_type:complete